MLVMLHRASGERVADGCQNRSLTGLAADLCAIIRLRLSQGLGLPRVVQLRRLTVNNTEQSDWSLSAS